MAGDLYERAAAVAGGSGGRFEAVGARGEPSYHPCRAERQPLKILFVMEHPGVGSLVPALHLLNERGHRLELGYQALKSVESQRELQSSPTSARGRSSTSSRRWGTR